MNKTHKLAKPIGDLKEVPVKTLKIKFLSQLAVEESSDIEAIFRMLSTITGVDDFNIIRQFTIIDFAMVLLQSWRRSYRKDVWVNNSIPCECGARALNFAKHKLDVSYTLPEAYSKVHDLSAYNDDDELQRYQVKIRPITLGLLELGAEQGEVSASDALLAQIESVDGGAPNEDHPLSLWSQINQLLPQDMEDYEKMLKVKVPCKKCGAELISEIGVKNFDWLQNK